MRLIWTFVFTVILVFSLGAAWWVWLRDAAPRTLSVAAGERGSDSYTLMREVAEVLARYSDTLRLEVRVSPSSSLAIAEVARGTVDLATIDSNTPAYDSIQLVADLFPDFFLFITRDLTPPEQRENPFDALPDLRRHPVAIPPPGAAGNRAFWSVIDHYGLPPEQLDTLALPRAKAVEAFFDRRADGIFFLSSLRDPGLLRFIERAGLKRIPLKFLPVEQAAAMALKRPYLEPATIVRGAFDGAKPLPVDDLTVPSLHRLLVANAAVDANAVDDLIRTIFAKRLDLMTRMPLSSGIRDPRSEGLPGLALHPGAARFYDRDHPSFLQENAEPMALVVTILAMLASAGLALRRSLANRAKNRADTYNDELLAIAASARSSRNIDDLRTMRETLGDILERAVHALDQDKVTEEGFQSFSLLWSSVRESVSERIRDVRDQAVG